MQDLQQSISCIKFSYVMFYFTATQNVNSDFALYIGCILFYEIITVVSLSSSPIVV
jgi:hypothetical protein